MKSWMIALLLCATANMAEAKLYKWVDSQGRIHYSDTMPETQTATQGTSELNKRGLIIKEAESPEQKAKRLAEENRQKELIIEQKKQALRDKALRQTYTSTAEIDTVRDRNIEQVDAAIKTNLARAKAANVRLAEYQRQSMRFVRLKKPLPADLVSDIESTKQEIEEINTQIAERQQDKIAIASQAETDKKRLKELLGL